MTRNSNRLDYRPLVAVDVQRFIGERNYRMVLRHQIAARSVTELVVSLLVSLMAIVAA